MKLDDRCTTWIHGKQCSNLRSHESFKCALHKRELAEAHRNEGPSALRKALS